ncbi:MAG: SprT family zinc-dependent metalloprotease [Acidovorax sp.]|uniref:M48 family metallopeptidase n=1 Tax=Acidovorax sp. TaxID=1872122 RepID=UPI0026292ABD|nr:SprT family zinc-dependent metalloprotease [Acidovorax sp.]MDH4466225.1 SprT family zinc-dependent metalloprotease [Acidovorax sp.]
MQRLVQLALDLFDPPAPSTPAAPPVAVDGPSGQVFRSNRPQVQVNQSPDAIEKIADGPVARPALPAAPLPSLLSPAEFRHPQANREVLLGDALVAYALQRARRRTIGFTVGADGLSVRAPSWVTLGAVDAALRGKADWILRKLAETRERHERLQGDRVVWADGAELPYLGEPLRVVLDPGHRFAGKGGALVELGAVPAAASVSPTPSPSPEAVTPTQPAGQDARRALHIGLPHSASPAQIRDAVQAWLMRDARRHFTERLNHFAPQLGVQWASLRLSSAQTRWGSAKSDGSIRLNWRLLHYRPAIIDYVVVHELAHLRVMDHSPRFWDTVATVVPDYADLRRHLRKEPVPPWE